jgi:hypothetical protein
MMQDIIFDKMGNKFYNKNHEVNMLCSIVPLARCGLRTS